MTRQRTKAMGFGTFDGLHPGHVSALRQLRQLGDETWVVIARDVNVKRIKGQKPYFTEQERLKAVQKLGLVDHVILGDKKDFTRCLKDHRPDALGLGYDQKADVSTLQTQFPTLRIVRFKAMKPHVFKSSLLRIKQARSRE